jgi:hypothetical protein
MARDGVLVEMPVSAPDANHSTRRIEGTIAVDGGLVAKLRHSTAGDPARTERQIYSSLSREEYTRRLEIDARRQVPGARLTLGQVDNDTATNRFELTSSLEAPSYAQVVQNRLLIVRPPEMTWLALPTLETSVRRLPIQVEAREDRDIFELTLPAGASVDEVPESRTVAAPFGRFSVSWQVEGTRVVRTVILQMIRTALAPSASEEVQAFLGAFREAERQPLILARR